MQENRSRLQAPEQKRERLEDRYGSIALPALKAALDATRAIGLSEPKQMTSQLPEKWRQFDAQS